MRAAPRNRMRGGFTMRRWFVAVGLALAAGVCTQALAQTPSQTTSSQSWPSKPIRIIVPLTAGSASDVMGRIVADQLSAQLGQPIVVENSPGAGQTIGMREVAKAEPGGYKLIVDSSTQQITTA